MVLPDLKDIKRRRKRIGMRQRELARRAGVSQSLIAKLESERIKSVSYITAKKIFEVLERKEKEVKGEERKAGDIMTAEIIFATPEEKVKEVIRRMDKHKISQMPVFLDEESMVQVGSVSEGGILKKLNADQSTREKAVKDIMEEPFPTVNKSMPVSLIAPLLEDVGAVLVMEGGKPAGIISKTDVLKTEKTKRVWV